MPHIVKTIPGFTNKNNTKKTAIETKLIRAEKPIQNVDVGLTELEILAHVPSQTSL